MGADTRLPHGAEGQLATVSKSSSRPSADRVVNSPPHRALLASTLRGLCPGPGGQLSYWPLG